VLQVTGEDRGSHNYDSDCSYISDTVVACVVRGDFMVVDIKKAKLIFKSGVRTECCEYIGNAKIVTSYDDVITLRDMNGVFATKGFLCVDLN